MNYIVYICLKMVTMIDMSEETRQLYLGIPMAGILVMLLIIEVTIAFVLLTSLIAKLILRVVSAIRIRKARKVKSVASYSPQSI